MRVLVVTNLYPTQDRPYICPFVKEQVESLRECYSDSVIDVRIIEGERPRWGYIRDIFLLPITVMRGKYDIVHAHFGLTLVSTLFVHIPVVITFHGSDLLINPTKHISKLLAPMASRAIVVSNKLKACLGYGDVIPCGIDVKRFLLPPDMAFKSSPKLPGELTVLFPSDPERPVKNYDLFLAVCKQLEMMGCKVKIVHLVNVERIKVPELYWNCDIMLLTSFSEGSPTVVKEAIAAKLPFVSVDVGDVREWADLVEFGAVASGIDPSSIARSVIDLLAKIDCRSLLDNAACLEAMDIENQAKRIMKIYNEVLERRG